MSRWLRWPALVPAMMLMVVGCAESGSESPDHEFVQMPIINGDPPDAPEHAAIVGLHQAVGSSVDPDPFCSGTLVTPDVVVTAAHCLDIGKGKNFKTMSPSSLAIYVGDRAITDPSPWLSIASETLIYPSYDRRNLFDDIGLVRLAVPVPASEAAPVAHLPQALGITAADIGALLNFGGFGDDENGDFGTKLQADGTLGGLGCTVPGCYGADDPATQISYTQYTSGPCFGDSGGPAFIYRGGTPYVAGVTSWGDQYCTEFGVSTRVDAYHAWIDGFIAEPDCTADGVCNPECAPGDDPDCTTEPDCSADGVCNPECAPGDDPDCSTAGCGDGVCGAGESCDGRNGTSACIADCPGKLKGKPSTRYCYVEGVCEGGGCP